jgi:hypothetical protein
LHILGCSTKDLKGKRLGSSCHYAIYLGAGLRQPPRQF